MGCAGYVGENILGSMHGLGILCLGRLHEGDGGCMCLGRWLGRGLPFRFATFYITSAALVRDKTEDDVHSAKRNRLE